LPREPARPAVIREHRLAPWFAVATVCFGAFMGQLDASIVTLAFPALERQFRTGLAGVQWVSLAYLLVLIALLVPVGRLSDRIGRKNCYLLGFGLFALASAACGLAGSLPELIGLRALQAAGAALLQANSVALVTTSMPARSRRAGLGVQAAAQAAGLALGPVAGGLLVVSAGWRWIFLVNVPVALIAVTAGWFLLPRSRGLAGRQRADPGGAVLLALAASAVLALLSLLSGAATRVPAITASAAVAVLACTALPWWERRAQAPMLDLRMLTTARLGPALAGAMCAYLVLFGPLVLVPQVSAARHGTALDAGLMLAALPAGFGLAAAAAERVLPGHWTARARCAAGGAASAACVAALAVPAPPVVTALLLALTGAGLGCYIPANNAEIMAAVPATAAATAGGMVNMARGLGTALGVAAVTLALHAAASPQRAQPAAAVVLAVAALAATWAGSGGRRPHAARTETGRDDG